MPDPLPGSTLVIGYGSSLRRDDAAGRRVVAVVAGWAAPGVRALEVHQLTPELAEPLAVAGRAIFVDAAVGVGDPAHVTARPVEPSPAPGSMAHAGSPAPLLWLARVLYGRAPEAWLVTIPASELGLGEGLSPQAARGVAEALDWIADRLGLDRPDPAADRSGCPQQI